MFPYFEYNANYVVLAPFLFQPISAVFNNNKKKGKSMLALLRHFHSTKTKDTK